MLSRAGRHAGMSGTVDYNARRSRSRGGRSGRVLFPRRTTMRKLIPMLAVAVLFSGVALLVRAAEEKTITGDGQCAKCSLSETKKCQNVVVVKEDGKEVKYYMDPTNAVAKKN